MHLLRPANCGQRSGHISFDSNSTGVFKGQRLTPEGRLARPKRHSVLRAANQGGQWEPEPSKTGGPLQTATIPPPPPPPERPVPWYEAPFASRRSIAVTMLAGSSALWLVNHQGAVTFADKPNIPFKLLGFTDLGEKDFVYFKTAGGNWVGAAEDEMGRLFMIDQAGDLYYDSGDPQIGLYAMDTQGNLFNFYNGTDGQRKITPVGNVSDLRRFKISELAGVKLDREISLVAFEDGSEIPLPPGTGYTDEQGQYHPPGEVVEGFTRYQEDGGNNPFKSLFGGREQPPPRTPDRFEVDLNDRTDFNRQIFDQVLLDDPTLPGYQPSLPPDFDPEAFAREVEQERAAAAAEPARRPMPPRR